MKKILSFSLLAALMCIGVGQLLAYTTHTVALDTPSGLQQVTPNSMDQVIVGRIFTCGGQKPDGTNAVEYCQVTSVTSTTFTATFANYHVGQWAFTNDPRIAAAMWGT